MIGGISINEQRHIWEESLKFLIKLDKQEQREELITYDQVLEHVSAHQAEDDTQALFKFRKISAHQGPLHELIHVSKGSVYNAIVKWKTGESTYEPLPLIASDDPVTCAVYGRSTIY